MNKEEIMIKTLENENQLLKDNIIFETQQNEEKKIIIENLKKEIELLEKENENQKALINQKIEEIKNIQDNLNQILNSRSYKVIQNIKKFFRR